MKSLAELKRIAVGQKVKLVKTYDKNHKLLNTIRAVNLVQSNAIRFEPMPGQKGSGSWLYFPKASDFLGTEKGFIILEDVPIYDDMQRQTRNSDGLPVMKTVEYLEYELIN